MSFTINTNIASLQAQQYLNQTQTFQNQTIQEVTSGDRIVNSGDDPSGLAIANSYRSNEAVLTQGIANANDGLSQLQIADGGISNISQLLDSARTLATESASDTFTGDRGVLNQQFQSVLQEIDRQAQAIGLNQGGSMAKALNVFIGGGQASGNITATQNGTVSVNLSNSTVDAKSLGLEGVVATGVNAAGTTDIGPGSQYTSVNAIVTNGTNLNSISNNTTNFIFTGPGFTNSDGSNKVDVAVNLTGVTDTNTLVAAINQAIQNAGNGSTQQSTAFKNANITASITTNANGQQTLAFSSATTAFQVQGGDQVATALMGNFAGANSPVGAVANVTATAGAAFSALPATGGTVTAAGAYQAPAAAEVINMQITGMGLNATTGALTVNVADTDTVGDAVTDINTAIAANTAVAATGLQAVNNNGNIELTNASGAAAGQAFTVQTAGDVSNALGFGSWVNSTGVAGGAGNFGYSSLTAAGAGTNAKAQDVQISLNGGKTIDLGTLTGSATLATALATMNTALNGNAATAAAGIEAVDNAGKLEITSTTGEDFRLNFNGGTGDAFGFGDTSATTASSSAAGQSAAPGAESVKVRLLGMGLNGAPANDLTVSLTSADTAATAATKLNAAIAANATVAATGVQAVNNNGTIEFQNGAGNSFQVMTAGDVGNVLGFGSWANSAGSAAGTGTFNYSSLTATGVSNSATQGLQVSVNGGATVNLGTLTGTGVESTDIATLNAAFQNNATTRAAGLTAVDNGSGKIEIESSSGQDFRLNFYGGTGDAFGFGASNAAGTTSTAGATSNYAAADSINSLGAQQSVNAGNTDVYKFTGITDPNASQTITLTAVDANGAQHTLNIALNSTNAGNLDQAVNTINQDILASNDSTLQQIGAFKQENNAGTAEGIRFMDAVGSFSVSLGASPNNVGIADGQTGLTGGTALASASNGAGSTANISNTASAQAAVTALGTAVTTLGNAQAQVGIGENDFTYAVNLANSQLTNFQAAESQIRDADLAQESANLTKSQIMLQAGVAALAQANSAPQQVLTLLQH